jgi:two-component system response regulator RegX3
MYALLIAQNADEAALLSLVLQRAGLVVSVANDVPSAVQAWPERPADLVLIATGGDLVTNTRSLRSVTEVPLIVIGQVDELTHCAVLRGGADLVIQRPFSAVLLISQVRALMRRAGGVQLFSLPSLSLAGLTLDPATRSVHVGDRPPRRLTFLEFRLLYTLMIHRGQVLTPEMIVEQVWGYDGRGDKDLVRGLVRRLRTKVEPEPGVPRYVLTSPGVGYCFAPQEGW